MPKAKTQAVMAGPTPDEIEAAFYEAMQNGDIDKLMACWADEDDVFCVHPGGPRVVGAGAIRAAFDAMFSNGRIRAWPQQVRKVEALSSAVHSVLERIEVMTDSGPANAWVLATNIYHRTSQGWRMVAHHASPGSATEAQEINETPTVLH
jgi:ketosteroid isomerase-like protein